MFPFDDLIIQISSNKLLDFTKGLLYDNANVWPSHYVKQRWLAVTGRLYYQVHAEY